MITSAHLHCGCRSSTNPQIRAAEHDSTITISLSCSEHVPRAQRSLSPTQEEGGVWHGSPPLPPSIGRTQSMIAVWLTLPPARKSLLPMNEEGEDLLHRQRTRWHGYAMLCCRLVCSRIACALAPPARPTAHTGAQSVPLRSVPVGVRPSKPLWVRKSRVRCALMALHGLPDAS
jgi:hypothetical protein